MSNTNVSMKNIGIVNVIRIVATIIASLTIEAIGTFYMEKNPKEYFDSPLHRVIDSDAYGYLVIASLIILLVTNVWNSINLIKAEQKEENIIKKKYLGVLMVHTMASSILIMFAVQVMFYA